MKSALENLRLGQFLWATVEESVDNDSAVVNLHGDFVSVTNDTETALLRGQKIQLVVESLIPLKLRLLNRTRAGWRA